MSAEAYEAGPWDPELRVAKARKIEAILQQRCTLADARVLDVGTGSGIIAAHLAKAVGKSGTVIATDVRDQRQVKDGYRYVEVSDIQLPFGDASFDIVVSNHVIEHVGGAERQQEHLRQIRRVLRPGGWCYLATPNRWAILEPHFRLPFLSWLPRQAQTRYVRLFRKGAEYDCRLVTRSELRHLSREAGLHAEDETLAAMRIMAKVETLRPGARVLLSVPAAISRVLRPFIPTMIFMARRS